MVLRYRVLPNHFCTLLSESSEEELFGNKSIKLWGLLGSLSLSLLHYISLAGSIRQFIIREYSFELYAEVEWLFAGRWLQHLLIKNYAMSTFVVKNTTKGCATRFHYFRVYSMSERYAGH